MEDRYKEIENGLKKKWVFAWTPKYQEEFQTSIKYTFIPLIGLKVFEKLQWDCVFRDENSLEAKRRNDKDVWTEKITVSFDAAGTVSVKSVSLGNENFDRGHNSLRVKLFIHVFNETLKEYDHDALKELEKEYKIKDNWEDYVVPASLPPPAKLKEPNIFVLVSGSLLLSVVLAYSLAFITLQAKAYIIGVFELGIGLAIGYAFKWLIRWSNYLYGQRLLIIAGVIIVLVYSGNQYFQYHIIISEEQITGFSFIDFIKWKFENGLQLEKMNLGWIGLVVAFILQLVITYVIVFMRVYSHINNYLLEKIPTEVIDYVYYLHVKNKTEVQIRAELSAKGWVQERDQDLVFGTIAAIQGQSELNRME